MEAVDALLSLMQVSLWLSDSLVTNCGQFMPSLGLSIKPLDATITRFGIGVCHGHRGWCKKCVLTFECEYLDLDSLVLDFIGDRRFNPSVDSARGSR